MYILHKYYCLLGKLLRNSPGNLNGGLCLKSIDIVTLLQRQTFHVLNQMFCFAESVPLA